MQKPFNAPVNSKRMFDLIKVRDDNFKIAFFYALRDTLVCQDIDVATSIAYGPTRFKCVTLNGVVIDYSGVMSGGGKTRRGAMPTHMALENTDNSDDIMAVQEELKKKQEELKEVSEVIKKCQNKIQEIATDFREAEREKQKYEGQLNLERLEAQEINAKIQNYQQLIGQKVTPEETKNIVNEIERLEKERLNVLKEIDVFRNDLAQIEVQIEQAAGRQVVTQKGVVANITVQFNEIEKEVSKMNAQIQTNLKNQKTIKTQQQKEQMKLEKSIQQIKQLKESQVNLEDQCMNLIGRQKAAQDNERQLISEIQADNQEKQKFDQLIAEIRSAIDKIQKELEEAKTAQKKANELYLKANTELEKVRTTYKSIIDNYEFMDELEEIASFNIQTAQQAMLIDSTQPEEQQEKDNKSQIVEQNFDPMPKKSLRFAIDKETISKYDVFADLMQNELDSMESVIKDLTILKTFEQESLAKQSPNLNSILEFKKKFADYKDKIKAYREIVQTMHEIRSKIDELRTFRYNEFTQGFNLINMKLKETYQMLTNGGDAELELIDSLDPFSEGVVFSVRPPKKSWKQMLKLSGGEKTLSSLSLIFALHFYKPTPLYFMDEIDAALDFKNVSVVGRYIRERTKNAQFIIISLRNHMFEIADRLIGVYKVYDQTKIVATLPRILSEKIGWKGQGLGYWQEQQVQIEQNKENERAWVNAGKQQVDGIFQEVLRATPAKKSLQKKKEEISFE